MLVADDPLKLLRAIILQRGLARQIGDPDYPPETGFGAELLCRYHPVRTIKGARHDLDSGTVNAAEAEGRATLVAEVTLGD